MWDITGHTATCITLISILDLSLFVWCGLVLFRVSLVEAVEQWVLQTIDGEGHLFFTAFRFVLQILYDEGES